MAAAARTATQNPGRTAGSIASAGRSLARPVPGIGSAAANRNGAIANRNVGALSTKTRTSLPPALASALATRNPGALSAARTGASSVGGFAAGGPRPVHTGGIARAPRLTTPATLSTARVVRAVGGGGGAGPFDIRGTRGFVGDVTFGRGGDGFGVWRHAHHPYRAPFAPAFAHSFNYAYRPAFWGGNPWWGAGVVHPWHGGCWNYGWGNNWAWRNSFWNRPTFFTPPGYGLGLGLGAGLANGFAPWGLGSWTLGSLAYDTGYYSYHNPYPAPPVTTSHTTVVRYAEPITVVAANHQPGSEPAAQTAEEKASAAFELARGNFKAGDYLAAAAAVDEAIALNPGDPVLHEFRSLALFALGRYGDAAGVLHSVLASGPGWNWDTLIGLYGDPEAYTAQFRKLEEYVVGNPESAESHFLLGYHYLVGENLAEAYAMFDRIVALKSTDTVARQLRSLLADSAPKGAAAEAPEPPDPAMAAAERTPVRAEQLHGIWKALSGEGKFITLSLTAIGTFTWNYEGAGEDDVLSGEWSIDEAGLLVLADDEAQMVADIALNEDGTLRFVLAGSPEEDPGLTFTRE